MYLQFLALYTTHDVTNVDLDVVLDIEMNSVFVWLHKRKEKVKKKYTFTKAKMLCGNIYSLSNEWPLCLNICSFRKARTLLYINAGLERYTAVLFPVKECILAVTIHSNLIVVLYRSTLTTDEWRTSCGVCIDYVSVTLTEYWSLWKTSRLC